MRIIKSRSILFSVLLLISLFLYNETYSQALSTDTVEYKKKDTVCIKYNFHKGDTLIYKVSSNDSIIIGNNKPLTKKRYEVIELVCDSVKKNGHFILTQRLTDFLGYESMGEQKNIERTTTPWENRRITLEIDSLGKRFEYWYDNDTKAAMGPGGAFQPILLVRLGSSGCKAINESWIVNDTTDYPENGLPAPVIRYSSLYRMQNPTDTLGYSCARTDYILTANGGFRIFTATDTISAAAVINSSGKLYLSTEKHIPVHLFVSEEQKLTLRFANDKSQDGKHYINSFFTLHEIKPFKAKIQAKKTMPVQKPKPQLKKKKRR